MEGVGGEMVVVKTPDKSKRDEWSEGGVMSLLDAYEAKWVIRNRAKLKGSDWEDIAREVSTRDDGKKAVKTPNQCKNKIEAMKKRYRMESAMSNRTGSGHSWQFYARMDRLVKGRDVVANGVGDTASLLALPNLVGDLENDTKKVGDNTHANAQLVDEARNCKTIKSGQDFVQDNNQDDGSNTVHDNSEFSTPHNQEPNIRERILAKKSVKRRKSEGSDVAESIKALAHSMLKIEQARMEMYKDSERLRAEAEIKRAEMDLKRTEIIAKTQLQIVNLLVKGSFDHSNRGGSSSLVAEPTAEEKNCKSC